jgi:hypothetical protein
MCWDDLKSCPNRPALSGCFLPNESLTYFHRLLLPLCSQVQLPLRGPFRPVSHQPHRQPRNIGNRRFVQRQLLHPQPDGQGWCDPGRVFTLPGWRRGWGPFHTGQRHQGRAGTAVHPNGNPSRVRRWRYSIIFCKKDRMWFACQTSCSCSSLCGYTAFQFAELSFKCSV